MERAEGLLGGKFLFKRQNDRTIDKTKVVCSICQEECSYHRSSSSLSYHLNAKHQTESSLRLDGRQPTLHDFSRKYHTKTPLCLAYIPFLTAREHEKFSSSSKLPPSPLLVTTGHQSAMTITWVSQLILF